MGRKPAGVDKMSLSDARLHGVVYNLQARKVAEELQDTVEWLQTFAREYGLPDEIVDELKSRLEYVQRLAGRL